LIITCLKFGWPVNQAVTSTCADCVCEYLQMIFYTLPLGIANPLATSAFGAVSHMLFTLEPTSGSVSLDGRDVLAEPDALWSVLGYLPQDFGFFPHLTGQAMLEYLLELKGVATGKETRTLAASLLERVNLA